MKKVLLHGLIAGVLAGIAAIVYNQIYSQMLMVDFSVVVNPLALMASNIFGCLLASLGYFFFAKMVKTKTNVWFNIIFIILTFASFVGPLTATLPTSIESPEMFVGLTEPMHLFPIVFWLATKSLFD
jgi:hypothetical protein